MSTNLHEREAQNSAVCRINREHPNALMLRPYVLSICWEVRSRIQGDGVAAVIYRSME